MKKKTKKTLTTAGIIAAIFITFVVLFSNPFLGDSSSKLDSTLLSGVNDQTFAEIGGTRVWIPDYDRIECVEEANAAYKVGTVDDNGAWYQCGRDPNFYSPKGCTLNLADASGGGDFCRDFVIVYDCTSYDFANHCKPIDTNTNPNWKIDYGHLWYVDPYGFCFGDENKYDVTIKADVRRLSFEGANNYRAEFPDCSFQSVVNALTIPKEDYDKFLTSQEYDINSNRQLPMGSNYAIYSIARLNDAYSFNVVQVPFLENGRPVYIDTVGFYYRIKETQNGELYADVFRDGRIQDSRIKCIPSMANCDPKTLDYVEIDGASCTTQPVGYQAPDDLGISCKWRCEGGKYVKTSDCIDLDKVQDTCTSGFYFDYSLGKCVSSSVPPTPSGGSTEASDYTLGIVFTCLVLAVMITLLISLVVGLSLPSFSAKWVVMGMISLLVLVLSFVILMFIAKGILMLIALLTF